MKIIFRSCRACILQAVRCEMIAIKSPTFCLLTSIAVGSLCIRRSSTMPIRVMTVCIQLLSWTSRVEVSYNMPLHSVDNRKHNHAGIWYLSWCCVIIFYACAIQRYNVHTNLLPTKGNGLSPSCVRTLFSQGCFAWISNCENNLSVRLSMTMSKVMQKYLCFWSNFVCLLQ